VAHWPEARLLVADGRALRTPPRDRERTRLDQIARSGAQWPGSDLSLDGDRSVAAALPRCAIPAGRERPARALLHARQHAPKGVLLSHRASYLRRLPGRVPRRARAIGVHVPAVPHGRLHRSRSRRGRPRGEIAIVEAADAEAAAPRVERRRREPALRDPRGLGAILEADTGKVGHGEPAPRSTPGPRQVPIELVRALKERFPQQCDRDLLRLDRVRLGHHAPDADVLRKPGQRRPPSPGVDLRSARRRDPAAQRLSLRRLFRESRRDARRAAATAGSTRAISASSTTRATCTSSAARRS
jgi:hypothetical protein